MNKELVITNSKSERSKRRIDIMKQTASKLILKLSGIIVMLSLALGITEFPTKAASNGIYIATATPHYRNPSTGTIEDSGGESSEALGQSMTESATYGQALVEVDPSGNTYVTVRIKLMDNIQNPQFQVDGSGVAATLMQEDYSNNTADYRMKVNSEGSVIRCNMYVVPMGREVIFYITVSNLQSGSGDFITSVTVEAPQAEAPQPTAQSGTSSSNADGNAAAQVNQNTAEQDTEAMQSAEEMQKQQEQQAALEAQQAEEVTAEQQVAETQEAEVAKETKTEKKNSKGGIAEYDASGKEVKEESKKVKNEKKGSSVVGWVIGSILAVAMIGAGVWYFCFYRKKNMQDDKE